MENRVIEIGSVVAGRYRVERVLGQGGMGVVVQATHLQLQQSVALKFLLPDVLGSPEVVERFVREAQAMVRLRSEHVARVIDVGTLDTGAPYMVFEFLEGADLASFPRAQLTVGLIIDLMLQACEALAEAHALGIVHRDVKPANLFVTRRADGALWLKVLDFGISKNSAANTQLTATQSVLGTAAYMSPEQMRSSRDVDHRSDIWALGIVMYELLQGRPPFDGESFSATVLRVAHDPPPRLTVRLPGDLENIIYRCLDKSPAMRFQTCAELAAAIAKYAHSEAQATLSVQRSRGVYGAATIQLPPPPPHSAAAALPSTISGSVASRTSPPSGGRRWSVLGFVGALVLGGAIALVARRGGEPGPHVQVPIGTSAGVEAAAPGAGSGPPPATEPAPPAPPPATVNEAIAIDAGAPDAAIADAGPAIAAPAAAPTPSPDGTGSSGEHPRPPGDSHATPTRPATPGKPEKRDAAKPAPPKFDRGD